MKIENLPAALLLLFIVMVVLAIVGWGASFLIGWELTLKEHGEHADIKLFIARVMIGTIFLGFVHGVTLLWDLFASFMRH